MRNKAAVAALVLLLPGCALIKQGTTQFVTFKSKPPAGEIWVGGKKQKEHTPATLELPKYEQVIMIRKAGYYDKTIALTCRTSSYFYWSFVMGILAAGVDWVSGAWREFDLPNGTVEVVLDAREDNPDQTVMISSNPPGATIRIDNRDLQPKTGTKRTPAAVEVHWDKTAREKQVVLRMQGFQDAQLSLVRGQKTLHKDLDPASEIVRVQFDSTPPGAMVLIDGIPYIRETPASAELEWYTYTPEKKVEFRLAGYHPEFDTIKDKNRMKIEAKLRPRIVTVPIRIDCTPVGSTLEIDGKRAGDAPAEVMLDWSVNIKSHKVKLSRPGYESQEIVVDESRRSVVVRLRPALPRLP